MTRLRTGQVIHGFAGGIFGRDSYTCRRVEAVGADWVVTRDRYGVPGFAATRELISLDIDDRAYCDEECEG